jgi:c-di-GMP-binding flagellar brake protein YcgR
LWESFVEKRKYPRCYSSLPIRYRKLEKKISESKGALIKNISEGGIKVVMHEFVPLNGKLAVEIPLASGQPSVKGTSRVAWMKKLAFSEQYEVGMEFLDLNQGDSLNIAKFIFTKNVEGLL